MALPVKSPQFNWGREWRPINTGGTDIDTNVVAKDITNVYAHYNDYYMTESSQQVTIRCEPKAVHVVTLLSEPVKVSGQADWAASVSSLMLGGSPAFAMADFLGKTIGGGQSLRQPWMSRKIWKGSTPLNLSLNLKFIATGATQVKIEGKIAKETSLKSDEVGFAEVYWPTCQLLSLLYPGKDQSNNYVQPGPSAFHSFGGNDAKYGQKGSIGDVQGTVGYPVDVQVGNFILFQNCFVTKCSVSYSSTLDGLGYPQSAQVQLDIESYEAPFVDIEAADKVNKGELSDNAIALTFTLFKLNQTTENRVRDMVRTGLKFIKVCELAFDKMIGAAKKEAEEEWEKIISNSKK
jgi:hypothetical protein